MAFTLQVFGHDWNRNDARSPGVADKSRDKNNTVYLYTRTPHSEK